MHENVGEDELIDVADFFKIFGDATRLSILLALDEYEELQVSRIAEITHMSPSAISQQLKTLRSNRLVRFRKEGRSAVYRLSDDHIRKIIKLGFEHYEETLLG